MKISVALLGLAATANALELTPDVSRRMDSSGVRNMLSLALARDGHRGIASVNTLEYVASNDNPHPPLPFSLGSSRPPPSLPLPLPPPELGS